MSLYFKYMLGLAVIAFVANSVIAEKKAEKTDVLIIRIAGKLKGAPKRIDATTHATDKAANTYIFTDEIIKQLKADDISATVVNYPNYLKLEKYLPVKMIVFAGPTYGNSLPKKILKMIPVLKKSLRKHPDLIISCFVSCWKPPEGLDAVNKFTKKLKSTGTKNIIKGGIFCTKQKKKIWSKDIAAYVKSLKTALKPEAIPKQPKARKKSLDALKGLM